MNVLIVYAHPEPSSLNGALKNFMVEHLEAAHHAVQVSDLYQMNWKAVLDETDRLHRDDTQPFHPSYDSKIAYETGTQRSDIQQEQDKLRWADTVIFQFPFWWFSMPAIMKGWFERVYAYGFAYGYGEHSDTHWGDRYGEGNLAGKRAMLIVTVGGWASHYSQRGINGPIDDLLFPIQHGMLHYPGFEVLPPMVVYQTSKIDTLRFTEETRVLAERLDTLQTTTPIRFRHQNAGDYDIPSLTLRDEIAPDTTGFAAHIDTENGDVE